MKKMNKTPAKTMTRRQLLKRALLGSALLASPILIPARALGLDGGVAANDRIVMGMVGQGLQGRRDLDGFLSFPLVQVKTVCDVVDKHTDLAASMVNEVYGNTDCGKTWKFEELTHDDAIDVIYIGTPEHWHTYIALDAMKNGKDVFCQKPETLTVREGQLLRDMVRQTKQVFSGGSQRVWGDYELYHKIIRAGYLGRILTGHAVTGGSWWEYPRSSEPVPEGVHWDRWLGPIAERPFNSFYLSCGGGNGFRDISGGGLASWGGHCWGGIMYAMQLDYTGPTRVTPEGVNGCDYLTWEFANGMKIMEGNAWGNQVGLRKGTSPESGGYISFTGEEGTISEQDILNGKYPIPDSDEEVYKGEEIVHRNKTKGGYWSDFMYYPSLRSSILADFLHCVLSREEPFRNVERSHRVCTLPHLGSIARFLRRELRFDPVQEIILDDEKASRMLDRPRRAPWVLDT